MKIVIEIPEVPKNDKQRWALANGTPYIERPHGEWRKRTIGYLSTHECSVCGVNGNWLWYFCPSCGADMRDDSLLKEEAIEDDLPSEKTD